MCVPSPLRTFFVSCILSPSRSYKNSVCAPLGRVGRWAPRLSNVKRDCTAHRLTTNAGNGFRAPVRAPRDPAGGPPKQLSHTSTPSRPSSPCAPAAARSATTLAATASASDAERPGARGSRAAAAAAAEELAAEGEAAGEAAAGEAAAGEVAAGEVASLT